MPIAAFGWWAAWVILVNYILIITFFPAVLSFWYQNIKPYEKCPCKQRLCTKCLLLCFCFFDCFVSLSNIAKINLKKIKNKNINKWYELIVGECKKEKKSVNSNDNNNTNDKKEEDLTVKDEMNEQSVPEDSRCMEKFLGYHWAIWIITYRYFVLLFFIVLMCFATYQAAQIEQLSKQEDFFPEGFFFVFIFFLTGFGIILAHLCLCLCVFFCVMFVYMLYFCV